MNYGTTIYNLRKTKGYSQEKVANELNLSRQSISLWETNQATPSMDNMIALAKLFNVSLDELIGKEDIFNQREKSPNDAWCEVAYKDSYKTIHRRRFMYPTELKVHLLIFSTVFFYVFAISAIFRLSGMTSGQTVFLIISIASIIIGTLLYPLYFYIFSRKTIKKEIKYKILFFENYLITIENNIETKIEYENIKYFIDRMDFILLCPYKENAIYVPKFNNYELSNKLSKKIYRRRTKKTFLNK